MVIPTAPPQMIGKIVAQIIGPHCRADSAESSDKMGPVSQELELSRASWMVDWNRSKRLRAGNSTRVSCQPRSPTCGVALTRLDDPWRAGVKVLQVPHRLSR
jgi:hypothetical protein